MTDINTYKNPHWWEEQLEKADYQRDALRDATLVPSKRHDIDVSSHKIDWGDNKPKMLIMENKDE